MFNAISWQGYWIALALLSVFYYASILLLFFRKDLKAWMQQRSFPVKSTVSGEVSGNRSSSNTQLQPSLFGEDEERDFQPPATNSEEHLVYACMDELTAFFQAARSRKWSRQDLLQAIKGILFKYPAIKESEYKASVSQVIQAQAEHDCSIHLKAEDVVGLWL